MLNQELILQEDNPVVSFVVTEDKPFNQCFQCHSFRSGCSGPNPLVMSVERLCEFLQMARVFRHLSYQDTADGTDLSLATVKRILTGKVSDPSFFAMAALTKFLVGDPNGKHPCAIPNIVSSPESEKQLNEALLELDRALADNGEYRAALDNIHISYKAELDAIRAESQRKIDYLMAEVERLRLEAAGWRAENDRKGRLIDTYLEKLIIHG